MLAITSHKFVTTAARFSVAAERFTEGFRVSKADGATRQVAGQLARVLAFPRGHGSRSGGGRERQLVAATADALFVFRRLARTGRFFP